MGLQVREMEKRDYNKAIQFAIKGMHFNWYTDNKVLLNIYGRYFWYLELMRATQVIAVYDDDNFAGVLLAEIHGEPEKYQSFWKTLYVKFFNTLQNLFADNGVGVYEEANREMFSQYCSTNTPDGEILFLASNPELKIKGIGSFLLRELESRVKDKKLFLYTDNACTYQFYEHRGFDRVGDKNITIQLGNNKVELQCFLYSKEISIT